MLVTGSPGSGKSDLVLRLLDHGFTLVADDQVILTANTARAPDALRGLLEVRGLGIMRLDHIVAAPVRLLVRLSPGGAAARLPEPDHDAALQLPAIDIDPFQPSAPHRVTLALRCLTGAVSQVAGSFAA